MNDYDNRLSRSIAVGENGVDRNILYGQEQPKLPNYSVSPNNYKNPYGVTFEAESSYKTYDKKKYKEDLDYLINLRKIMNEDDFEQRYGHEFRRKVELMNDKMNLNKYQEKNFMKGVGKDLENDMLQHQDDKKMIKQYQLDMDKQFIDYLDYQRYLENQKRLEQKLRMKSDQQVGMDNYYQKKNLEEVQRQDDRKLQQRLIEENNKRQDDREYAWKSKINGYNDRMYDRARRFNEIVHTGPPQLNDVLHIKDDYLFNRKVAELKAIDKEHERKDESKVSERLKELEHQREIDVKLRYDKMDHQKLYKNYLDNQSKLTNEMKQIMKNVKMNEKNELIMPSYNYPNLPVAMFKKANDPINWIKANHTETLRNNNKNYYLGDSALRHNPIIQPVEDKEYNKYLNKQKALYGTNIKTNTLADAGNKVLA